MLPTNSLELGDLKIAEEPSLTYQLNLQKSNIKGKIDDIEALKQAIYKILITNRYTYAIYNWNYGVEFQDFIGQDKSIAKSQIPNGIQEALSIDSRIISVHDFIFKETEDKGALVVQFVVTSIFGDVEIVKEVKI